MLLMLEEQQAPRAERLRKNNDEGAREAVAHGRTR